MTHRVRWDPKTKTFVGLEEIVRRMPDLNAPTGREPRLEGLKRRQSEGRNEGTSSRGVDEDSDADHR
jgi:hypothetical protein